MTRARKLSPGLAAASLATTLVVLTGTFGGTATAAGQPGQAAVHPTVSTAAKAKVLLEPGATGWKVRALQVRLKEAGLFRRHPTGVYNKGTTRAVRNFQITIGRRATGLLDVRTRDRLAAVTRTPSKAEQAGPGKTLMARGSTGPRVLNLEARMRQIGWFDRNVDKTYDRATAIAVRNFQAKRRLAVTGRVDPRTRDLLHASTRKPTKAERLNQVSVPSDGQPLDSRCLTGQALCIDKTSRSVRWVVDGQVREDLDVRFGSSSTPTRDGAFTVYRKSRDHVSSLYNSPMPFALFFSGGQAVHYSPDFARVGYSGASHGCVNVRDYAAIAKLFDVVPIGTPVIVYWS
ncbi:L,D-transpeptidase family protein [Nocardioides massiliensis]|uniref:Peptidoglycan hydrolase-like protein with peptidoglycan-binding domain n=1 Tax=Nocardioides massiliensis TaxID=1325935 RepID=A0ABT9NTK3_9ACTN|nr:peptidoglycan-binding protein [Nocardioides massiliensis]MDP9823728.1 peptidoglycan hydrolase-like protein with peptidoglycan-binding domain [Nocardioides massiliensis]